MNDMKLFTMIYRWLTSRCTYCGTKKHLYDIWGIFSCCPTDMSKDTIGCSKTKYFIKHREAKVQRALGLLITTQNKDTRTYPRPGQYYTNNI